MSGIFWYGWGGVEICLQMTVHLCMPFSLQLEIVQHVITFHSGDGAKVELQRTIVDTESRVSIQVEWDVERGPLGAHRSPTPRASTEQPKYTSR